jgi:N-methylhydantoinase A
MPISRALSEAPSSDRARAARASPTAPLIMLSSGGVLGAETAGRHPVRMIESGPAAGALAACHYARELRHRPAHVLRHGRHHRQGLRDRGPYKPLITRTVRGRSALPLQAWQRPARHRAIDRPDRDRRRRRLASPASTISACSRSAPRAPAPIPARPAMAAAARARASPTPTSCSASSTPTASSAATCRSISRGGLRRRLDAASAQKLGLSAERRRAASTRRHRGHGSSCARTHATDRGIDYRGLPLSPSGAPARCMPASVAELLAQHGSVIVPPQSSVLSAFGTLVTPVRSTSCAAI